MDKRPACGPYITRKMRRKVERERPVDQRAPKNTLGQFMQSVQKAMPKAAASQVGYRGGSRMLYDAVDTGKRLIASFRHPTKRATAGRLCFVTVTR